MLWNQGTEGWIVYDLKDAISLGEVVIYNQNEYSGCGRCIRGFDLYYSRAAGASFVWERVLEARWTDQQASDNQCPNPGRRVEVVPVNAKSRYWKLDVPAEARPNTYYGMMEVEFYSTASRGKFQLHTLATPQTTKHH